MKKIIITLLTICLVNSVYAQVGGNGQATFGEKEPESEKPKPVEEVTGAGTSGTAGSEALKALEAKKKNNNNEVSEFKDNEVIVKQPEKTVAGEEYRVALLIGNTNYDTDKVLTAVKDIPGLSASLLNAGFEVIELRNASKDVFFKELAAFVEKSKTAKVSVLYFSGHSINYQKDNYLVPIGVEPASESALKLNTYNLSRLLSGLKTNKSDAKQGREALVILDVVRYNHFYYALQQKSTKAMAPVSAPEGVVVMSASTDGTNTQTSTDLSLFGYVLSRQIQPNKAVVDVIKSTKSEVERLSDGAQKPWFAGKPSKTILAK